MAVRFLVASSVLLAFGCGSTTAASPPVTPEPAATSPARAPAEPAPQLSFVVLVQGNLAWMGNHTYLPAEHDDYLVGAYPDAADALDAIAGAAPAGARGALIVFGDRVEVRQPFGAAAEISRGDLFEREVHGDWIAAPLEDGIAEARRLFAAEAPGGSKLLLILGNGGVRHEDFLNGGYEAAREQLASEGIEVHTFFYNPTKRSLVVERSLYEKLASAGGFHAPASRDSLVEEIIDALSRAPAESAR